MKDPRGIGLQFATDIISAQKNKYDKFDILLKMAKQEEDKKKVNQNEKIQEVY